MHTVCICMHNVCVRTDLKPWIIEVNSSPSLSRENALDYQVQCMRARTMRLFDCQVQCMPQQLCAFAKALSVVAKALSVVAKALSVVAKALSVVAKAFECGCKGV